MRNSVILSTSTTMLVITVAVLGAYSLTRFNYPGRERMAFLVLATYLLPSVVLVLPLYLMMVKVGIANSLFSLVWPTRPSRFPTPCGCCDPSWRACRRNSNGQRSSTARAGFGAFVDVVLPQAMPGIISTALFTFIVTWNEYFYALILVNTDEARPLTTGVITMLVTSFNIEWSLLMAAAVAMSLPLIIIFVFLQGYLVRGFAGTGVKG